MRPYPPAELTDEFRPYIAVEPASNLKEWVIQEILEDTGNLFNEKHIHLLDSELEFMWASDSFEKQGRVVLGQAEQVSFMAGGWKKARMEQQVFEWFGYVPKFIITLSAEYCNHCSNVEFCSLVEHELFHIAQKLDEFGTPKFDKKTGMPVLTLVDHDVSEFIEVVNRYGTDESSGEIVTAHFRDSLRVDMKRIDKACNG